MVVQWSYPHHFTPILYYGRAVVIPSLLQHDLYFIMVVKWSFFHHYSTTCTLLWSYNGHSLIISHLYFIMIVQWSFPHHFSPVLYYGRTVVIPSSFLTCTLLWSYSGHSLIIPARFTTNWPRQRCQWWLVYTCLTEVCLALGTKAETRTTANGPKEETWSETTLTASALKQNPRFKTTIILVTHFDICTKCIKRVDICTMCIKHVDICTKCIKHVDICTMCIKHVDILETSPFFQVTDWQLNDD